MTKKWTQLTDLDENLYYAIVDILPEHKADELARMVNEMKATKEDRIKIMRDMLKLAHTWFAYGI